MKIPDRILKKVQKPSRYVGKEFNIVKKDLEGIKVRFAFCFPDVYDVGMSHLGLRILYHTMNKREDTYCERAFAPWPDMEKEMRDNAIPLFSLETKTPLSEFDMIGFTLQYEMSYTNILNMLDLAGLEMLSKDRKESDPLICAGGPCAYNPEPLAEIIDFFIMGEGEEVNNEILECYAKYKDEGLDKKQILRRLADIKGIYVPEFYEVEYNEDGTIKETIAKDGVPEVIEKRIIENLDDVDYPVDYIVPLGEIVHDRAVLELFRGCIRGCRFCQAGYLYRPVREKSVDNLCALAEQMIDNTGYSEISLSSLSTSDYTQFNDLANRLLDITEERKINLSLPSLRIDSLNLELLEKAQKVRKSGLTVAPEAGTQRLRNVINKGLTEEDILNGASLAFKSGWNNIKLYFMIGLPTETYEDLDGIADLANKVLDEYYKIPKEERARGINVTVSASSFVPKPFTPFEWVPQNSMEEIIAKQEYLKEKLKRKGITFNYHQSDISVMEAVFARGDRKLNKVLVNAVKNGCKFDGWGEYYNPKAWAKAFEDAGIEPGFYARRDRGLDEVFPWDFVSVGVSKEFLKREYKNAQEEKVTPNCRQKCAGCGIKECGERDRHGKN